MKSVIIGAGTYGEVYLAYLQEAGTEIVGFLDDAQEMQGKTVRGVPVLGKTDLLPTLAETHGVRAVYCPLGNNRLRVRFLTWARELGYATPRYIHPSVVISPGVEIGDGVYILPNSLVMPYVKLGNFSMLSVGVNLIHHTVLKEGVFLSNGVNLGASIVAGKLAYIGMGSTIMTGVKTLGEDCLVGAGAVVIRDVPAYAVVAGVPAKVLKFKDTPPPFERGLIFGGATFLSLAEILFEEVALSGIPAEGRELRIFGEFYAEPRFREERLAA